MSNAMMTLSTVFKQYGTKAILNNLNFDLPRGSVTGLLGKNGSGKTTLIKCALGLVKPESGEITVMDEPAWNLSADAKARLGYVPQESPLYPWMRVKELTDYIGSFYTRWDEERMTSLLIEWEIDPNAKVKDLSVGQNQKLSILVAMGHAPDLMVFDEPAAALDPMARRQFLKTILDIASAGDKTVLFSTHITSDLERVADRVAILKDGQIVFSGELDTLKESVKRLHIESESGLPQDLNIPNTLRAEISECDALITVEKWDPSEIPELERQLNATVHVQDLNLEDIFMEMHS